LYNNSEYVPLFPIISVATSLGLLTSVTSNSDSLNPPVEVPPHSFSKVSYPNPRICVSSTGCRYVLYPGIFKYPRTFGFKGF